MGEFKDREENRACRLDVKELRAPICLLSTGEGVRGLGVAKQRGDESMLCVGIPSMGMGLGAGQEGVTQARREQLCPAHLP